MTEDELMEDFFKALNDLNNHYWIEYNKLCNKFSGRSFDRQISDKLQAIVENNLFLYGSSMNAFYPISLNLFPWEVSRIKEVFDRELEKNAEFTFRNVEKEKPLCFPIHERLYR